MGEQFDRLSEAHQKFIAAQPMFFVATAARDGSVNVSPKGRPGVAVLDANGLLWLNLTGSGNETAAHLLDVNRITLMWCAFEGPPMILRAYGQARAIHKDDREWATCAARLPASVGARQYYEVEVERVQTSCGYQVPLMDYREDRTALTKWAEKKGDDGLEAYWQERNARSIDGFPTRRD